MAEETAPKWHGSLKMTIKVPIDKAWAIAGNFCGLDKWLKTVDKCEKIEGEYQQPGCVRYLIGNSFPRADGEKSWAKEKLLSFDGDHYHMKYTMIDGNFGLVGYVNNFKMQHQGDGVTLVDWSYEVNPVENRTEKTLEEYMTATYRKSLLILEELVPPQSD